MPTESHDSTMTLSIPFGTGPLWIWARSVSTASVLKEASILMRSEDFCLGYNSLYNVQTRANSMLNHDHPDGQRIWSWLMLCENSELARTSSWDKPWTNSL